MCLQKQIADIQNEIKKLSYNSNSWNDNYNAKKFVDPIKLDNLYRQEEQLILQARQLLKENKHKEVYGF